MSSFQVPQFLDSGDKIIFNLNLRQFGYALGGFLISMGIFGVVGGLNPNLGIYAFLPALPVMLISAYAAFGRYNGRDADFYIVKFIIFTIKPKFMVFGRQPDNEDLNRKLAEYTEAKIKERWAGRLNQSNKEVGDQFAQFRQEESEMKADKIRLLGQAIDTNINNTLQNIQTKRLQIDLHENQIRQNQSGGFNPATANSQRAVKKAAPKVQATNFFDEEDE